MCHSSTLSACMYWPGISTVMDLAGLPGHGEWVTAYSYPISVEVPSISKTACGSRLGQKSQS
jgi:hypothetical protein